MQAAFQTGALGNLGAASSESAEKWDKCGFIPGAGRRRCRNET